MKATTWICMVTTASLFLAANVSAQAVDRDLQAVVSAASIRHQQKLASRGVVVTIDTDLKGLETYKSWREPGEATTAQDRAARMQTLINLVGDGLYLRGAPGRPVTARMEGQVLHVALAPDVLSDDMSVIDIQAAIQEALGIRKLEN